MRPPGSVRVHVDETQSLFARQKRTQILPHDSRTHTRPGSHWSVCDDVPSEARSQLCPSVRGSASVGTLHVSVPTELTEHFSWQPPHPDWHTGSHKPDASGVQLATDV
jgi:hypothetical protein